MEGKAIQTIKSINVYETTNSSVAARLVTLNGIPHVGLQRIYTPPQSEFQFSAPKAEVKGVFIPLQAWDKFQKEAIPEINKEIDSRRKQQGSTSSTSSSASTAVHKNVPLPLLDIDRKKESQSAASQAATQARAKETLSKFAYTKKESTQAGIILSYSSLCLNFLFLSLSTFHSKDKFSMIEV